MYDDVVPKSIAVGFGAIGISACMSFASCPCLSKQEYVVSAMLSRSLGLIGHDFSLLSEDGYGSSNLGALIDEFDVGFVTAICGVKG